MAVAEELRFDAVFRAGNGNGSIAGLEERPRQLLFAAPQIAPIKREGSVRTKKHAPRRRDAIAGDDANVDRRRHWRAFQPVAERARMGERIRERAAVPLI